MARGLKYNVTYDVLRNVTYDVAYNQVRNITYNSHRRWRGIPASAVSYARKSPRRRTIDVADVNATVNVTTTYNVSSHQPVDVVLALGASRSVSDADFVAENRAGRELLQGLRDSLTGDLHAGVAVWAVDGVSRKELAPIANATDVDAMEDAALLLLLRPSRRPIRSRPRPTPTTSAWATVSDSEQQ